MTNEDENKYLQLKINTQIYSLDVISSVCYTMNEKAYFFLDGEPEKEIIVNIKKKNKDKKNEEILLEFQEMLITYLDYKLNSINNQKIKEMIVQRSIITNNPGIITEDKDFEEIENSLEELFDEEELEEINNIAKPWEENNN